MKSTTTDWYLQRGCTVVPCKPGEKHVLPSSHRWSAEQSRQNRDRLTGNAAMVNGTGGVLVVDVDTKNGADAFTEASLGLPATRTVRTVTGTPVGFGRHLLYELPDGFEIRTNVEIGQGVEVSYWAMLPGSEIECWELDCPDYDGFRHSHRYEITDDRGLVEAPGWLLDLIEHAPAVETVTAMSEHDAKRVLEPNLRILRTAGDGERNRAFTRVAAPVILACRALGKDSRDLLGAAYRDSGGSDQAWLTSALTSAERAADRGVTMYGLPPSVAAELDRLFDWAVTAPWPGRTGPTDRRVYLAVIERCREQRRADTSYGARRIADTAGVGETAGGEALIRLTESGLIERAERDGFTVRRPVGPPIDSTGGGGESTPLPLKDVMDFPPLHRLWVSTGLSGRHGHLFDLIGRGLVRVADLAEYVGSHPKTVRDTLAPLVEHGLIAKVGPGEYRVSDDAQLRAAWLLTEVLDGDRKASSRKAALDARQASWNSAVRAGNGPRAVPIRGTV